ncbi:hypothetical protein CUMW_263800 [Citrus unshiu]|uniref:Glucose-6-phosphate dehydrogenase NAD-binding domain-containing protein n=1 Tax=Citrus unshiu TaxID=55188 RepID=A0A2H5QUU7_CITUN|nr:hypothetical protein CUMW_263800 [Citrus unshiu]
MSVSFSNFPAPFWATGKNIHTVTNDRFVLYGGSATICQRFCGLKLWLLDRLNLKHCSKKHGLSESKIIKNQDKLDSHLETSSSNDGRDSEGVSTLSVPNVTKRPTSKLQAHSPNFPVQSDQAPSLCIAVIGATGELARRKIFPALFALYYSGFLPENVGIVGYSRKNLTDEDLRSIIASTLTCRIDHRILLATFAKVFKEKEKKKEGVKVLRSIRRLEPSNVILGQYKATFDDKVDVKLNSLTPTYFAAVLYIDNARWDGVPFLIKAGMGLIKHRVEIRIQFRHVPGNIYHDRFGHNINLATNELILRDVPDEAILVRVNNKVPGLGLQLDASELNSLAPLIR